MARKNETKVRTICPQCQYTFETAYHDMFSSAKCPDCSTIFPINEKGKVREGSPFYRRFTQVVAFGKDKITGQEVAIDTKGKRVDPSETRYNIKEDKYGWRATGKKVKGYVRK